MTRFVEFTDGRGKTIWLKPDCVACVFGYDKSKVGIYVIATTNALIVAGTVSEVMAKLQGEPEPAKAADDVVGWWVRGKDVIYVIGFRPDGRMTYLWDGGRATTHDDVTALRNWTRDPNRKGWEG